MINLYMLDLCNNSAILRLFLLLSYVFRILCVLLPLILMFKFFQTCYKHVVSGEPISKSLPDMFKKLAAAIIIFFIPTICGFFFNLIDDYTSNSSEFQTCFENIDLDYIQDLQQQELEDSSEDVNDTSTITPDEPLLWPDDDEDNSNNGNKGKFSDRLKKMRRDRLRKKKYGFLSEDEDEATEIARELIECVSERKRYEVEALSEIDEKIKEYRKI